MAIAAAEISAAGILGGVALTAKLSGWIVSPFRES
jgi:hypothetical protein